MRTSAPAKWFRLYAEFATDPKVQMLSEQDQRRLLMLFCLRCSNGDVTLQCNAVAFQLRISNSEWAETRANLIAQNLINEDNKPVAWEKRQFDSDTSAERVRKHREEKKRSCNVTSNGDVTPQRQRQRQSQRQTLTPSATTAASTDDRFENFWSAYPKKTGKEAARKSWSKVPKPADTLQAILKALVWQRESEQWNKEGGQFIPNPATYLNQQRWLDEPPAQVANGLSRFGRQSAAAAERWLQGQDLSEGDSHA